MFDQARVAEDLEGIAPGPELGRRLASIDRSTLGGHDLVTVLRARSRQVAHLQAELLADLVAVAEAERSASGHSEMFEFAADEIRAALSWTRRAADSQLSLAYELVETFPHVWQALSEGRIDLPKAKTIVYGLAGVESEVATAVADSILEKASNRTTGQIAARLQRLVMEANPSAAADHYRQGVTERRVVMDRNQDGTATLIGFQLPAERALGAVEHINLLARAAKSADDPRTIDQIRADVLLDLLEGHHVFAENARRPVIDLRVDLTTLAGLDQRPAEVPGWGPVIANVARQVAQQSHAQWRVTVTDPVDGAPVWNGLTRRRPNAALSRHVQTRNPTCVFPGCRRPAIRSDLDHTRPWHRGGPTETSNLGPLCRHDHRLKDEGGWQLEQIRPAVYRWTSPLSHQYLVVRPPP